MKVIDAFTGRALKPGDSFASPDGGNVTLLAVDAGFFSAQALLRFEDRPSDVRWVPLAVRWTHPRYFMQRVGFVPS